MKIVAEIKDAMIHARPVNMEINANKTVVARMMENVIRKLVNACVQPAGLVRCAPTNVRHQRTVLIAKRIANVSRVHHVII